jgi:hypothetical protein
MSIHWEFTLMVSPEVHASYGVNSLASIMVPCSVLAITGVNGMMGRAFAGALYMP